MISKEEIKKLADLARIEIGDIEAEKLGGEMDAILGYVKVVSEFKAENDNGEKITDELVNVMREDQNSTAPETHSKDLIAEFPKSENNYLKVKKIL
jgi:aspartyl-tRNA(Asn)/glutamyl-tRNA(Gln) amidotransferase subunit C